MNESRKQVLDVDLADKLQVLGVSLGIIQMLRGYAKISLPLTVLLGFLFLRKRIPAGSKLGGEPSISAERTMAEDS